jgi:dienelactone hydrolase
MNTASMRVAAALVAALGAAGPLQAQAPAAPPPVSAFFATEVLSQPLLSPDGKRLAVLVANEKTGRLQLGVIDLDAVLKPTLAAGYTDGDIHSVQWVNNTRLSYGVTDLQVTYDEQRAPGLYAVDHDGKNERLLIQRHWRQAVTSTAVSSRELTPLHRLLRTLRDGGADVIITRSNLDGTGRQVVNTTPMRLNTLTGQAIPLVTTVPAGARWWIVDDSAQPRMVYAQVEGQAQVHWRAAADAPWTQVASFDAYRGGAGFSPAAIGPDGEVYATAYRMSTGGTNELFRFDRQTLKLEAAPLVSIAGFDYRGHLIFDHAKRRLLGVRVVGDAAATAWIDDAMKQLQERVDKKLPGLATLVDIPECNCGRWAVVTAYSDRQPPAYLLYDREKDEVQLIGRSRPGIDPRQMAQRDFVRFKARDGLTIPMHVTKPAGKGPWPTVVLVHDGPYIRGGSWGWTPASQFLASRGYLVLEPEFRGSRGYGDAHFKAGFKQWGLKMQDDIVDGARWAISEKLADPQRQCIVGGDYGGYATLMGLIRDSDLFRCGVAWAAITDIQLLFELHWSATSEIYREHGMPVLIGDPVKDAAQLEATSPLKQAHRLKKPLLLAHGSADPWVPVQHGTRFVDAVRKSNSLVEWVEYTNEGHALSKPENRYDFYSRMEKFLATHLQAK